MGLCIILSSLGVHAAFWQTRAKYEMERVLFWLEKKKRGQGCYIEWLVRTGKENMVWGSDLECVNNFAAGDVGAPLMWSSSEMR